MAAFYQGPYNPGTMADDASNFGDVAWTNPGNAQFSDDVYATSSLTGINNISHYLKVTNFGFTIPSTATITGVTVAIERKYTTFAVVDDTIKLVKGGTVVGTNKSAGATWPTSDTYATFGSSSDLWGTTLTYADVNASNFGVVMSCDGAGSGGLGSPSVDNIQITVNYTDSGSSQGTFF